MSCESQFVGDFIRMRVKYTAKWGLQIAEMIFQTRSRQMMSEQQKKGQGRKTNEE